MHDSSNFENAGGIIDYNFYHMTLKEKILYSMAASSFIFTAAYVFYQSVIFSLILCPLGIIYSKVKVKSIIAKRKIDLNIQFKDMLYSLSSSLSAGRSVEMSLKEVQKDLSIIYPDPDTPIIREVGHINKRLEMNHTIESAFQDFAKRSHLEDIENFVDVFHTCKRSGGNIIEVIKNTSNIISDKIEIKQEIDTILSQRRFEQKVLSILPILLIVLLTYSAGEYMEPVFTTIQGRLAMTVSVGLLTAAYFISKKIMNINV